MKKFISVLLIISLIIAMPLSASAASVMDFADVPEGSWYYDAVSYAVDNGLFAGTSNTEFSPKASMTRGMFVTVLGRKAGVNTANFPGTSFQDVSAGSYYAPYVQWASTFDIVGGVGDYKFAPNDYITREQIAKILYSYAKLTANDTSLSDTNFNAFPDKANVSSYAVEPLKWATTHSVINGSNGKLNPKGTASRAEVATIFMNSDDLLVKTEIVKTPEDPIEDDPTLIPSTGPHGGYINTPYIQRVRAILDPILAERKRFSTKDIDKVDPEVIAPAYETGFDKYGRPCIINDDGTVTFEYPPAYWDERALKAGWRGPYNPYGGATFGGVQYMNEEFIVQACLYEITGFEGGVDDGSGYAGLDVYCLAQVGDELYIYYG